MFNQLNIYNNKNINIKMTLKKIIKTKTMIKMNEK